MDIYIYTKRVGKITWEYNGNNMLDFFIGYNTIWEDLK